MSENKLVVLTFPPQELDEIKAVHGQATYKQEPYAKTSLAWYTWQTIKEKAKEADVKLDDAVIVFRSQDGTVDIKQTMDMTTGKGAGRGTFWGFLVGLILGGPIAGALGGLAIGAIYGSRKDKGIDDEFIKNVGQAMKPRSSAIFLLIKEEDYAGAIEYLKTFNAEIHESSFSEETETAVNETLENEDLAKAIDAEISEE